MTNDATLQPVTPVGDDAAIRRLREPTAQEAAATKGRLATRNAAARLFSGAVARLAEAKVSCERVQTETQGAQGEAVEDLLTFGLQAGEVVELLGISKSELHSVHATRHDRPIQASGQMNGFVNHPMKWADGARRASSLPRAEAQHASPLG